MTMFIELHADGETIGEALENLDRLVSDLGLVADGLPQHGVDDDGRDVVTVQARRRSDIAIQPATSN